MEQEKEEKWPLGLRSLSDAGTLITLKARKKRRKHQGDIRRQEGSKGTADSLRGSAKVSQS